VPAKGFLATTALCVVAALAWSCGAGHSAHGVLLDVQLAGPGPRPRTVLLTWIEPARIAFVDQPVLTPDPSVSDDRRLGTVFVETEGRAGPRRAILRGLVNGNVEWEGAARLDAPATGRSTVLISLVARRLPDADGDGLPDQVDDCPAHADATGACAETQTDAAAGTGGLPEAGAPVDGAAEPPMNMDGAAPPDLAPSMCPMAGGASCPTKLLFTFDQGTDGWAATEHATFTNLRTTCEQTYCGGGALAFDARLAYSGTADRLGQLSRDLVPAENLVGKTLVGHIYIGAIAPSLSAQLHVATPSGFVFVAGKDLQPGWNVLSGRVDAASASSSSRLRLEIYLKIPNTSYAARMIVDEVGWR
jgi:hypothetical protein